MNKENIKKRLRNWKTWVALFSCAGLILQTFGVIGFEGTLENVERAVYLFGVALGIWSDHEENPKGDVE